MVALRHEVHYSNRVVRCFAERPAHIDAMFREAVARDPRRDALVLGEERISYRALDAKVEAVASNLAEQLGETPVDLSNFTLKPWETLTCLIQIRGVPDKP